MINSNFQVRIHPLIHSNKEQQSIRISIYILRLVLLYFNHNSDFLISISVTYSLLKFFIVYFHTDSISKCIYDYTDLVSIL